MGIAVSKGERDSALQILETLKDILSDLPLLRCEAYYAIRALCNTIDRKNSNDEAIFMMSEVDHSFEAEFAVCVKKMCRLLEAADTLCGKRGMEIRMVTRWRGEPMERYQRCLDLSIYKAKRVYRMDRMEQRKGAIKAGVQIPQDPSFTSKIPMPKRKDDDEREGCQTAPAKRTRVSMPTSFTPESNPTWNCTVHITTLEKMAPTNCPPTTLMSNATQDPPANLMTVEQMAKVLAAANPGRCHLVAQPNVPSMTSPCPIVPLRSILKHAMSNLSLGPPVASYQPPALPVPSSTLAPALSPCQPASNSPTLTFKDMVTRWRINADGLFRMTRAFPQPTAEQATQWLAETGYMRSIDKENWRERPAELTTLKNHYQDKGKDDFLARIGHAGAKALEYRARARRFRNAVHKLTPEQEKAEDGDTEPVDEPKESDDESDEESEGNVDSQNNQDPTHVRILRYQLQKISLFQNRIRPLDEELPEKTDCGSNPYGVL
jgi:hypothetical protein